jgi:hypothetical protein
LISKHHRKDAVNGQGRPPQIHGSDQKLDVHGWYIDQGPSDWVDVRGSFFFCALNRLGFFGSANPSGNVGITRFLAIATVDDVLGHFAPVHRNITGEFQGHTDSIPFDACDANDTNRVLRITNHNFFGFASCDDKHGESPPADKRRSSARG